MRWVRTCVRSCSFNAIGEVVFKVNDLIQAPESMLRQDLTPTHMHGAVHDKKDRYHGDYKMCSSHSGRSHHWRSASLGLVPFAPRIGWPLASRSRAAPAAQSVAA